MFPEDEYLSKLGRAIYATNYLEWLIIEIIGLLGSPATITDLAAMEGGRILRALQLTVPANTVYKSELEKLVEQYQQFVKDRNDVIHARPATTTDGKQRLYRWAPTRSNRILFYN